MNKPEFPQPRVIREDFMPEPTNKYRIKAVTDKNRTRYFPEIKFLFWWYKPFRWEPYNDGGFYTLEDAQAALCSIIEEPVVEFIDFDPSRDCK
jgi:hypothetical protein